MQTLSSYENYPASDFIGSPLKVVSRNPNPAPKSMHPLELNPVLNLWVDIYFENQKERVKKSYLDNNITATNLLQMVTCLLKEVLDIQEAISQGCCKKTIQEFKDMAEKANAYAILAERTPRLYPTL